MSAILVVDDDPQVLEVVGEMLRLEGYEVATAADGREAVAKFRSHRVRSGHYRPDHAGEGGSRDDRRNEDTPQQRAGRSPCPAAAASVRRTISKRRAYIGAVATLAKPFARSELISLVGNLLSEAES